MSGFEKGAGPVANASFLCEHNTTSWDKNMELMYTYFYLLVFIPGFLLNGTALWVLCRHISKKTKAVIFMINLALADLAQILSLPFRIYYYFTHTWPFGRGFCLLCFYLKYLNMYAAIAFLMCISIQRCVFLLHPFTARRWRRRYDLLISGVVWVLVSVGCLPFILMRRSGGGGGGGVPQSVYNASSSGHPSVQFSCFKDLPMRRLPVSQAVAMIVLAELPGFVIPLACISCSSFLIARTLKQEQASAPPSERPLPPPLGALTNTEKQRALRMVIGCSGLFLFCFAPYHINFLFYLMVSQGLVTHCATQLAVHHFHPLSLCMANLSCCLNPLLYYFLTAEFRSHLSRRASSFSSSGFSSPLSSPTQRYALKRLLSTESSGSDRGRPPGEGANLRSTSC